MSSDKPGGKGYGGLSGGNPLSLLQECFACGVIVVGARKRIVACTAEAAEHLHRDAVKLLNAPLNALPAPLVKLIQETSRSGRAVLNREIPLGHATVLRASILPVQTREQVEIVVVLNSLTSAPVFEQNLRRLDRGEKLPTELPYLVQTWNFGNELAMAFLPGEVVVDYSLRLKREYDPKRLWVNAYANDVPCYIPSKRVWREGGYEGGAAMIYYDRPTRLAEGTEDLIVAAVHKLMPWEFEAVK